MKSGWRADSLSAASATEILVPNLYHAMDAFAGLAWDDSKSQKSQNNTLGAQQQRQLTPAQSSLSSSTDSFGRLASAGQLNPISPKPSHYTPNGATSTAIPTANRSTANSTGADPFSGLFARGGSPNVNMSMADRRAHAERERRERERREKEKLDAQGAMWDQLDGAFSANGSTPASRVASPSPALFPTRATAVASPPLGLKTNPGVKTATSPPGSTDLFWSMHHSPQTASPRTSSPALVPQRLRTPSTRTTQPSSGSLLEHLGAKSVSPKTDAWSQLDILAAPKPTPATTAQPAAGLDPFDLDFLAETEPALPQAPSHQPTPPRSRTRTPGDFDFAERDGGVSTDEDDILGDLAKPVERVPTPEIQRRPTPVVCPFTCYSFERSDPIPFLENPFFKLNNEWSSIHLTPASRYWANSGDGFHSCPSPCGACCNRQWYER